jgi:hypothetical protein
VTSSPSQQNEPLLQEAVTSVTSHGGRVVDVVDVVDDVVDEVVVVVACAMKQQHT